MSIFSNRYGAAKQEASAYTEAVLGLVGDRDPMQVLENTPADLANLVAGLTPADLARAEAPGKWSMLYVMRHLADSEIVWAFRLRRIIAENGPPIQGYDQDLWSERLHYDHADLHESLDEMRSVRAGNLRLIRSLTADERKRFGVHSERGEESVEHLVRMYAGHDILHLRQLARIRETLGLGAPA